MAQGDSAETAQETLARAQRYYAHLIEHSLGLVCAHDLDGNLLFINPAAARSLGYEAGEVGGGHLRQFLAPSTRDRFDAYLERIRRHGIDSGLMRLVAKDGQERVWMYRNVLYDEPPESPHVLGHAIDITERIQAEHDLRRSQETLTRTLAELDARVQERTSELQQANAQLHAEIVERQAAEAMREQALDRERENLAFWTRVSKEVAVVGDYEATLHKVARLPVPFLADWSILHVVQEQGTCRCIAGAHVDPHLQSVLEGLVAAAPALIDQDTCLGRVLATARTGRLAFASEAGMRQWFGSGAHANVICAPGAQEVIVMPLLEGDNVLGALSLVSGSERSRFAEVDRAVLDVLGQRIALAIVRARLYKQAHEANRLKDEFLATLSHELRTPLQAVIGWARILRFRQLDQTSDHAAEVIERNAFALSRMVEDILDVSRIITGKLTLDERPVDVAAVVRSTLESVKPAARAKGVRLEQHIEQNARVRGDEHRLQQVIWNLLSNAVKFTGSEGTVSISLTQMGSTVNIVVADTGAGIRRDVLPFVFDRFRQGDASSTRPQGGLGLGLAIVRHIVELHGGAVRVESVEGHGATFTVELPIARSITDPESIESAGDHLRSSDLLLGARVLIVDAEEDARELVADTVRRAGALVMTAASAPDALRAVEIFQPEVLLADLGLPHQDGYELLAQIRERPPEQRTQLAAIALTRYTRAEDKSRALEAGFREHVAKPVEPQTLVRIVRRVLDERT